MYVVYYTPASDYPLRPIISTNIENTTVVTFSSERALSVLVGLALCAMALML